jgi:hypothetical protein
MFKVTPNPPDTDPASPYENLDSKKRHEAAEHALDFHLNTPADIKATPHAPSTMFIVNPQLNTETLLAHACESLASPNVITWTWRTIWMDQAAIPYWALRKSSCWASWR